MEISLLTERLLLRSFVMEDAEAIFRMSQEETLKLRMPDQVYQSLAEAAEIAAFLMDKAKIEEWPFVLGIALQTTGDLVGHVGLSPVEESIEIGYAIAMNHQGRGYASEAVAAFSKWAVNHFSLAGIWAILMSDNHPSKKVLERAGYKYQWGKKKKAFGGEHLCLYYLHSTEVQPCK